MNLFELVAVLSLNKSDYDKGLDDAEKEASTFGNKLKSGLGTAAKVGGVALAAVGAGATAVTKGLLSASSGVAELGDHIDKQSQKIGISAKAYQEWDFILTHNGASVDSLQTSMKTLSTQAADNAEEFAELGISQEQLEKSSPEELFETVIKRLQGMEAGTKRTAIASKLLGRGATELAPVLNSTSDEIEGMRKQAHTLGKVLSDETVKSSAAYEDSLYNLKTSLGGLKNKMSGEFLPSLVKVMDGLTAVFSGDSSAVEKVSEGLGAIMGKIAEAIPKVAQIASNIIKTLGKSLTNNLPKLIEAAKSIVSSLISTITENLPAIMDLGLEVIMALIDGIIEALPQIVEGLVGLVVKIVEKLPTIIEKLVDAAPKVISMLIKGLMDNLPKIISGLISVVTKIVADMPKIIQGIIDDIPNIISSLITGFLNAIPQLVAGAIQLVAGLVTNIPKIIAGLLGAIPNILKSILSAFGPLGEMLGGLFGGIFDTAKKIFSGIGDFIGGVVDKVKNAIGAMQKVQPVVDKTTSALSTGAKVVPTMASGGVLEKGQVGFLEGNGAEAVVPLENNQKWISAVSRDMQKSMAGQQNMTHSGTIRVEGVDKNGDNVDIYDYIIENTTGVLRRQIRMA